MSVVKKPISHVVDVNPRIPTEIASDGRREVDFVPMAQLSEQGYVTPNVSCPLADVLKGYTYFENGDVIVAKITPCMENGKAAFVDNLPHKIGFGSTEFHVLRPRESVDGRYLFYMVWNPEFRKEAESDMTGSAGQKRVPKAFFDRFEIPLPPLSEQKRIADILDKADAIRRKRQEAVESLKAMRQAALYDTVLNSKKRADWREERLGEVADVKGGIQSVSFDYDKRYWCPKTFDLPYVLGDFVLLAPKDILTKDENWINRGDMLNRFETIATSSGDQQLRSQVNNYLRRALTPKSTKEDRRRAYDSLLKEYPQLIEWYIKYKEDTGGRAKTISGEKVTDSEEFYVKQFGSLIDQLETETEFYQLGIDTFKECMDRVGFLKQEIENNGAYRLFYHKGKPVQRESDLQILFRLTWFATPSDFNSEVNNGRGPVDFKVSRGNKDKTLVEFKLASNSKLSQNLEKQVKVYEDANRTSQSIKVVFYFDASERRKVQQVLQKLKLQDDESIVLIDCRRDNKPSASNA